MITEKDVNAAFENEFDGVEKFLLVQEILELRSIKCPPISDGDTYICPIVELEAELEQHRWIPVAERLPVSENSRTVFVLAERETVKFCATGYYHGGEWTLFRQCYDYKITHWKPIILPEEKDNG